MNGNPTVVFSPGPKLTELQVQILDELKTGRPRCIGCGRFLSVHAKWNQCSECDTREEGLSAFFC